MTFCEADSWFDKKQRKDHRSSRNKAKKPSNSHNFFFEVCEMCEKKA